MLLAAQYVSLIAVCIQNESNLVMHMIVLHMNRLIWQDAHKLPLSVVLQMKCCGSGIICTARVQREYHQCLVH